MDPYASHQQLLIASALQSQGPMIEMGCGDYSTPLLAEIAAHQNRTFEVYTTDKAWGSKYESICKVNYIKDWSEYPYPKCGFTFQDSGEYVRDRKLHVPRLLETSDVVICHDFGDNIGNAKYSTTLNGNPKSVVMSNVIDIKLNTYIPVVVENQQKQHITPIVACVYKTGGDYTAEYVWRLYIDIVKHSEREIDFVVYTDSDESLPGRSIKLKDNLPGWWSKLELFYEFSGRTVFFDLDTIIVGSLEGLYSYDGPMALTRDYYHPDTLTTSVMAWNSPMSFMIPTEEEKKRLIAHPPTGRIIPEEMDQYYIINRLNEKKWNIDVVQDYISLVSYKVDCKDGVPDRTSIVCFHGRPRPHEIGWEISPKVLNEDLIEEVE
jgi:hypothetical protein